MPSSKKRKAPPPPAIKYIPSSPSDGGESVQPAYTITTNTNTKHGIPVVPPLELPEQNVLDSEDINFDFSEHEISLDEKDLDSSHDQINIFLRNEDSEDENEGVCALNVGANQAEDDKENILTVLDHGSTPDIIAHSRNSAESNVTTKQSKTPKKRQAPKPKPTKSPFSQYLSPRLKKSQSFSSVNSDSSTLSGQSTVNSTPNHGSPRITNKKKSHTKNSPSSLVKNELFFEKAYESQDVITNDKSRISEHGSNSSCSNPENSNSNQNIELDQTKESQQQNGDTSPALLQDDMDVLRPLSVSDYFLQTDCDFETSLSQSWKEKPVCDWSSEDVMEWCEAQDLKVFAEIFDGCGIDGNYLTQITSEDLVELGIVDSRLRASFLRQIKALQRDLTQDNKKAYTDTQQASPKLENPIPETNTAVLDDMFQNKWKSGHLELKKRRSNSLEDLTNVKTVGCRIRRLSTGDVMATPMQLIEKPLDSWSNNDVLNWLLRSGLQRFMDIFREKKITGKHLTDIDMTLLDSMQFKSVSDRELVLSHIYKLQNPQETSVDGPVNKPVLTSKDQEKYQAAIAALHSSVGEDQEVQFAVPKTPTSVLKMPKKSKPSKIVVRRESSDKKKKSGFYKLKEAISPRRKSKDHDSVQIWHDLKGTMKTCTSLKVHEAFTSMDIIQTILLQHEVTDDFNLFYLTESHINNDQVPDRELGVYECPLSVQRQWPSTPTYKFELRRRQGNAVKVTCRIAGMKPKSKSFTVAYTSTSAEVLRIALNKLHIKHVEPNLFCLLANNKENKEVLYIEDHDIILQQHTDSFILCEKATKDKYIQTQRNSESEDLSAEVQRNESVHSHSSGKSWYSGTSSSGSEQCKNGLDTGKLTSLEAQMASIEASITKKKIPTANQKETMVEPINTDNIELLQEIEVLKASIQDRDELIGALRKQNKMLKEQVGEVEMIQQEFNDLKKQYKVQQTMLLETSNTGKISLSELLDNNQPQHISLIQIVPEDVLNVKIDVDHAAYPVIMDGRGALRKGNRILEINGKCTIKMTKDEVTGLLKTGDFPKRLVVIKDTPRTVTRVKDDSFQSAKDDLNILMLEVDALTQENKDLINEIDRMKQNKQKIEKQNYHLTQQVEKLKRELTLSDGNWQELRKTLVVMRDVADDELIQSKQLKEQASMEHLVDIVIEEPPPILDSVDSEEEWC